MELLKIENLNKDYINFKLKNINLKIKENETISIIGKSGSGKTTLFNIITKFENYDSGNLILNSNISYLTQESTLLKFNTVLENIALPLILKGEKKENAFKIARNFLKKLKLVHLENRYPKKLSGGEKQRISFIQTLILANKLILLDEPFSALDYITKYELNNWLLTIKKEFNLSFLIITHDIEQALILSDKIYIMKKNNNISTLTEKIIVNNNTSLKDILKKLE